MWVHNYRYNALVWSCSWLLFQFISTDYWLGFESLSCKWAKLSVKHIWVTWWLDQARRLLQQQEVHTLHKWAQKLEMLQRQLSLRNSPWLLNKTWRIKYFRRQTIKYILPNINQYSWLPKWNSNTALTYVRNTLSFQSYSTTLTKEIK